MMIHYKKDQMTAIAQVEPPPFHFLQQRIVDSVVDAVLFISMPLSLLLLSDHNEQ